MRVLDELSAGLDCFERFLPFPSSSRHDSCEPLCMTHPRTIDLLDRQKMLDRTSNPFLTPKKAMQLHIRVTLPSVQRLPSAPARHSVINGDPNSLHQFVSASPSHDDEDHRHAARPSHLLTHRLKRTRFTMTYTSLPKILVTKLRSEPTEEKSKH